MSLDLTAAYRTVLRIRILEDELQKLCLEGGAGDLHFSKGQEAIAVGVLSALGKNDLFATHHRTIAHEIAAGAEMYPLVAELLGKRTGINQGRAGEMHLHNERIGHIFSFQLVGTCVPVAAGAAYVERYVRKSDAVVVVFVGDAATSNAQFHEGMTIASLRRVPLLVVVENNRLAGNIRPEHYLPTPDVCSRVGAWGVKKHLVVDGNDLDKVHSWAGHLLKDLREEPQVAVLECDTTRLCWHKQGQRDIRTKEEIAKEAERDPLLALGLQIEGVGLVPEWREEILAEVHVAIARAKADPPAEFIVGR